MRLLIAAVGRRRNAPEAPLIDEYVRRIESGGRAVGLTGVDLVEFDAARDADAAQRKRREWTALEAASSTAASPKGAHKVILDERGKSLTSADFAARIGRWRDDSVPCLTFMIGGPDGHDAVARESADLVLYLGPQTWPHLLVRVMLAEQIYRAMTILAGHPYHRP